MKQELKDEQICSDFKERLTIRQENPRTKVRSKLQIGWLSSSEYFHSKGYVEMCFDPKLKPYLLQLKTRFTHYYLQHIIRLNHSYSIRFYELLKQYQNIGWRTFEVDELKEILGLAPEEYKLYGHFKDRILEPVKAELTQKFNNDEIDLRFEYKELKLGRKIHELRFDIFSKNIKPQKTIELLKNETESVIIDVHPEAPPADPPPTPIQVIGSQLNMPKAYWGDPDLIQEISNYIKDHGEAWVKTEISYVNSKQIKDNYAAYLLKSLKGGLQTVKRFIIKYSHIILFIPIDF